MVPDVLFTVTCMEVVCSEVITCEREGKHLQNKSRSVFIKRFIQNAELANWLTGYFYGRVTKLLCLIIVKDIM